MEMLEAMQKCALGGYVARKAYPNRKYYKDENGTFPEAPNVDYIDFLVKDWEHYPADHQDLPYRRFNWPQHEKQNHGFE